MVLVYLFACMGGCAWMHCLWGCPLQGSWTTIATLSTRASDNWRKSATLRKWWRMTTTAFKNVNAQVVLESARVTSRYNAARCKKVACSGQMFVSCSAKTKSLKSLFSQTLRLPKDFSYFCFSFSRCSKDSLVYA